MNGIRETNLSYRISNYTIYVDTPSSKGDSPPKNTIKKEEK